MAKRSEPTKVKFMGSADIKTIPAGYDFGGQLAEPTSRKVVFDKSNNWVVDVKDSGLSTEAVDLLLASGDFEDVSKKKIIPPNAHQRIFLGAQVVESGDEGDEDESTESVPGLSSGSVVAGTSDTGAGPVGGSTTGATGA